MRSSSSSAGVLSLAGAEEEVLLLSGSTIVPSHIDNNNDDTVGGDRRKVVELVGNIQEHLAPDLWITDAQLHRHYDEKSAALDALFAARCAKVEAYWKGQLEEVSNELDTEKTEHASTKLSLKVAEEALKKVREQAATSAGSLKVSQEAQVGTIRRLEARAAELEDAFLDSQRSLNVYEVALLGLVDKRRNNGVSSHASSSRGEGASHHNNSGAKSPGSRRRSLAPSATIVVPEINNVGLIGTPQKQHHPTANLLSSPSSPSFSPSSPQQGIITSLSTSSAVLSPPSPSFSSGGRPVVFSEDDLLSADDIVSVIRKQRALVDGKLQSLQTNHLLLSDENEDLKNQVSMLESDVRFLQARLKESAGSKTTGSGSTQRGASKPARAPTSVASRGGAAAAAAASLRGGVGGGGSKTSVGGGGGLLLSSSPSGMSIGGKSLQSTSADTTSTVVPSAAQSNASNISAPKIEVTPSPSDATANVVAKTEVRMVAYESASTMATDCRRRRLEVIEGVERLVGELETKVSSVKPLSTPNKKQLQQQDGGTSSSGGGDHHKSGGGNDDDTVSIHAPPEAPTLSNLTALSTSPASTATTNLLQYTSNRELGAFSSFQVLVDLHRQIQRKDNQIHTLQGQLETMQANTNTAINLSKRDDADTGHLFKFRLAASRPVSARPNKTTTSSTSTTGVHRGIIASPPQAAQHAVSRPTSAAATQGRFTPIKVTSIDLSM